MTIEGKNLTRVREQHISALLRVYIAREKAELSDSGYSIRDGMSEPLILASTMRKAADMAMEFPGMKVGKLYEIVISTFPG